MTYVDCPKGMPMKAFAVPFSTPTKIPLSRRTVGPVKLELLANAVHKQVKRNSTLERMVLLGIPRIPGPKISPEHSSIYTFLEKQRTISSARE
jgi:hypothetical protein